MDKKDKYTRDGEQYYTGGEHSQATVKDIKKLATDINVEPEPIEGVFPDETARQIEHNTIRLCHIDVDVYKGTKQVFEWVWPRIPVGGIVIFDDYGSKKEYGVTTFVNEILDNPDN